MSMDFSDQEIICYATRRNWRMIMLWPDFEHELSKNKTKFHVKLALYILITVSALLSIIIHLTITVTKKLELPINEDLAPIFSMTGIFYMITIFVKNQRKLAVLTREVSHLDKHEIIDGFEKKQKLLNFISNFLFWYLTVCVIVYAGIMFFVRDECEEINNEKNLNETCGLITLFWIPFDTEILAVYICVYIYTFVAAQLIMKPNVLMTFHAFEMAQYIILKMNCLTKMIEECFDDDDDYRMSRLKLTTCILYHKRIIEMAKRLDECFSSGMLVHITITGIIFACIEKQFVSGNPVMASMHISGWIATLYFACHSGQLLINASEAIPEAIWFSKWYQADVRLQKDVLFFLKRSQKFCYLTVGPFNVLSNMLFLGVSRMSYSFFCLLTS